MKTIKERATEYAQRYMDASDGSLYKIAVAAGMKIGYIQGATDQQALDIEKACEWLKRELGYPMPDELFEQWCEQAEEWIKLENE